MDEFEFENYALGLLTSLFLDAEDVAQKQVMLKKDSGPGYKFVIVCKIIHYVCWVLFHILVFQTQPVSPRKLTRNMVTSRLYSLESWIP